MFSSSLAVLSRDETILLRPLSYDKAVLARSAALTHVQCSFPSFFHLFCDMQPASFYCALQDNAVQVT